MNREDLPEITHDISQPVNELVQCLSENKRDLGIFLGAGCPAAVKIQDGENSKPIIPDISGLTSEVLEGIESHTEIQGIILKQLSADGISEPNIEDILTHLRSLSSAAGNEEIRGLSKSQLTAYDNELCKQIENSVDQPLPQSSAFHGLASWIGSIAREKPVQLFTTNYDLLIEQALEDQRVPYFDGFVGANQPFFDPIAMEEDSLPPRWARLWKLHGSINWSQTSDSTVIRGFYDGQKGYVIHPSHQKYAASRRMPYLGMFDRLRAFFKEDDPVLVICGYSFRDDHLNSTIIQGLQGNPSAVVFCLLFGKLEEYEYLKKLSKRTSNLNFLAEDGAIIGSREGQWEYHEREQIPANLSGVDLPSNDSNSSEKESEVKLLLGDFAEFGDFLASLTGPLGNTIGDENVY